jgi:hypothetical protein
MKNLDIIIDSKIIIQNCPDEIFGIVKEKPPRIPCSYFDWKNA